MNTVEIMKLIREDNLECGAYTVDIKQGVYDNVLGSQILVYTHGKPDSNILSFKVKEFLLIVESAKNLPIHSFKSLITAKKIFGGTILKEGTSI
ncbi:hypothetical protein [Pelosinus sp. IPA-1]|uniref:hypothetical protein n=1 Tax=Pelosinus sp. IPA-1 TaxID=3029569 RepID=UPI0024361D64|nr:hypothetical protein [Pelosinus sp. IPA-1]GMB01861.1 hypothetical protein PIPA1_46610 [Pelosinus sp. IPA-1]